MPRERSPERDKAYELWKNSRGEMKLKDIAERLGVSDILIRKWKNQDKWDDQLKGKVTKSKSNVTNKPPKSNGNVKGNSNAKESAGKVAPKADEQIENIEQVNDELTDKQRLFCIYYVKYWNAGKAAQKAGYQYSYPNGFYEMGTQLRKKPQVRREIDRLKKNIVDGIEFEAMAVFQKYIDIACSDITDFLRFGQREEQVIGMYGPVFEGEGDEKKPVMQTVNFIDLADSSNVDGTLITEVKQGKDGISIKIADKMKALEFLTKYYDLLPDHHKRRIDDEKLKIDKERLEIEKAKAKKDDDLDGKTIKVSLPDGFDDGEE